jgi:hypothetical protein
VWLDLLGKLWNLPNTMLGLIYGGAAFAIGRFTGNRPFLTVGNNALQFHNCALMKSAMTLGNVVIYGCSCSPDRPNIPFANSPACHTVGREEFRHTQQGQILGPLYLPLHLIAGVLSVLRSPHPELRRPVDAWHRNNFMEIGPMRDRVF